jgi:hypothetical protein
MITQLHQRTNAKPPVFPIETGMLVATPGALDACTAANTFALALVARHARGDWGTLDAHDTRANVLAVNLGTLRVFSVYILPTGVKVWVITEADRSSTTILLPEEY